MKIRNYFLLCAAISLVWAVILLYVPGVADLVERLLLGFLATAA